MSGQFRAVAVLVALAAIVYVVVARHHDTNGSSGGAARVLVAKKLIQKGTPGDVVRSAGGLYTVASFPASRIDAGAIVSPSALAGRVAVQPIPAGQQLTITDFAKAAVGGPNPGGRARRAIIVKATSPEQIAAGSHVDVWVDSSGHDSNGLHELSRNLRALEVGTGRGTVTLDGTPQQAGRLIYVMGQTRDRLVLRLDR